LESGGTAGGQENLRHRSSRFRWRFVYVSDALDRKRDGVATAEAERRDTALRVALLQRVQQCDQDARARRADRVTERDGAAVHVDAVPVPAQLATIGQSLHRERLVRLDQVVVVDLRS